MKCPSCSAESPDAAAECAACGLNYAKWRAKAEKSAFEAAAAAEAAALFPRSPAATPASGLKITLGILGFLCAAALVAYAVVHRRVDPSSGGISGLIDPDPYRARIKAIEAALYRAGPPTTADAKLISGEATTLAGAVFQGDQQNPLVQETVGDLMEFAGLVAPPEDGAMLPNARLDWARRWEVIRVRRFAKASWLHAAVTPDDRPPPDFERAASRIQAAGHRLKTLMAEAPKELARFGKEDVTLADVKRFGAPAREKVDQWREWRTKWQSDVDQALLGFPKPDEVPPELQAGYDRLFRVAREARNPPSPAPGVAASPAEAAEAYMPGKESRDGWVESVTSSLAELDDDIRDARLAKPAADGG